jgi:hypothetical protein
MNRRERTLVLATLAAGLLGGTLLGYARLVTARDAATLAAEDLAECRRLAARLGPPIALAAAPSTAPSDEDVVNEEVIRRIESSARSAELPADGIERIEPASPQRVGADGAFVERPTVVEFGGVTLRQLFTFLHAANTGRGNLGLKQIRLSAPAEADTGDRWSVEATLTQLVRAPAPTKVDREESP